MEPSPWSMLVVAIFGYILTVVFWVIVRPKYETLMPKLKKLTANLKLSGKSINDYYLNKKAWVFFYSFASILSFVMGTIFLGVFLYLLSK
jgi:hypothetical protein